MMSLFEHLRVDGWKIDCLVHGDDDAKLKLSALSFDENGFPILIWMMGHGIGSDENSWGYGESWKIYLHGPRWLLKALLVTEKYKCSPNG